MSTLEKNLYKRVVVDIPQSQQKPQSSATYRSISSVNTEADSAKLYDIAVIKQDNKMLGKFVNTGLTMRRAYPLMNSLLKPV